MRDVDHVTLWTKFEQGIVRDFWSHPKHGPLPAVLLLLTVGTGVVDAVSILGLGRVFVANMTGNVVFIGFALVGAPGFSLSGSVVALVAFLVGAAAGGVVVSRTPHRGQLLRNVMAAQLGFGVVALVASSVSTRLAGQLVTLGALALALGMQNAAVRRLAVPDLTTTVLTMTLTGIGADLRRGDHATAARRLLAVAAMLGGACAGAALVIAHGAVAGLVVIVGLYLVVLILTVLVSSSTEAWTTAALPSKA